MYKENETNAVLKLRHEGQEIESYIMVTSGVKTGGGNKPRVSEPQKSKYHKFDWLPTKTAEDGRE